MTADANFWWAIHTAAGNELYAAGHIRRLGHDTFVPLEKVKYWRKFRNNRKGREVTANKVLMSRYIFGRFPETAIGTVNQAPGVSTVVHFGGDYFPLPEGALQPLFDRADDEGIVGRADWTKLSRMFSGKVGDSIKFAEDSPFAGIAAVIASLQNLDTKGMVDVDIQTFGSVRRVPVPLRMVARVA